MDFGSLGSLTTNPYSRPHAGVGYALAIAQGRTRITCSLRTSQPRGTMPEGRSVANERLGRMAIVCFEGAIEMQLAYSC
jgi:hypothetical protein